MRSWSQRLLRWPMALCLLAVLASCAQRSEVGELGIGRLAGAASVAHNRIYFTGGITAEGAYTAASEQYDPSTNQWRLTAPMLTGRAGAGAAAVEGMVYVVGGRTEDGVVPSVERYDAQSDSWSECAPMPTARWNLMVTSVQGRLYAIGGITGVGDDRRVSGVVEVYDPSTDTWTRGPSLPIARSTAGVAVLGHEIFIIGGRLSTGPRGPSATTRVDVLDCGQGIWHEAASTREERTGSAACAVGERIYVFGGAAADAALASIEMYDPVDDEWVDAGSLGGRRSSHSCACVGARAYVFGGSSRPALSALITTVEAFPGS